MRVGGTEAIKQAVAAGLGLAIVSRAAAADQLALGQDFYPRCRWARDPTNAGADQAARPSANRPRRASSSSCSRKERRGSGRRRIGDTRSRLIYLTVRVHSAARRSGRHVATRGT